MDEQPQFTGFLGWWLFGFGCVGCLIPLSSLLMFRLLESRGDSGGDWVLVLSTNTKFLNSFREKTTLMLIDVNPMTGV